MTYAGMIFSVEVPFANAVKMAEREVKRRGSEGPLANNWRIHSFDVSPHGTVRFLLEGDR